MRSSIVGSSLLVLMATLCSVGCSDEDPSCVDCGGPGTSGNPATSGGAASGGSGSGSVNPGTTGGSVSLGGSFTSETGGTGAQPTMPDLPSEVNVIITADNAYGFGYGTNAAVLNYFEGVENERSGDIFDCPVGNGPEAYVVPAEAANAGGFLYIISYADASTTQGVIAKFYREGAPPVFTGSGRWEVCATGSNKDPGSGGVTVEEINSFIVRCNAADLPAETTSVGWVSTIPTPSGQLVFGEDNSTTRDRPMPGNEFLEVCDIEPTAKWMWFDWVSGRVEGSPFMWPEDAVGENPTKDFLIFRLGADQVPRKPPT